MELGQTSYLMQKVVPLIMREIGPQLSKRVGPLITEKVGIPLAKKVGLPLFKKIGMPIARKTGTVLLNRVGYPLVNKVLFNNTATPLTKADPAAITNQGVNQIPAAETVTGKPKKKNRSLRNLIRPKKSQKTPKNSINKAVIPAVPVPPAPVFVAPQALPQDLPQNNQTAPANNNPYNFYQNNSSSLFGRRRQYESNFE